MEEIWQDIVIEKNGIIYDYTGLYQVSNKGRVRSLNYRRTGKIGILKPKRKKYLYRTLEKNGEKQTFSIHRLVATAFIPNPENKPFVNHIDENRHNNSVDNLEWCTNKENLRHGTCPQRMSEAQKASAMKGCKNFKPKKVRCIETGEVFDSITEASSKIGVTKGAISNCLAGRTMSAGGYHWERYLTNNNKEDEE